MRVAELMQFVDEKKIKIKFTRPRRASASHRAHYCPPVRVYYVVDYYCKAADVERPAVLCPCCRYGGERAVGRGLPVGSAAQLELLQAAVGPLLCAVKTTGPQSQVLRRGKREQQATLQRMHRPRARALQQVGRRAGGDRMFGNGGITHEALFCIFSGRRFKSLGRRISSLLPTVCRTCLSSQRLLR